MSYYPDLCVLRHGETEWNRQGRYQGQQDSPLTEKGKRDARRQKELLHLVPDLPTTAFVSPQGRARHTARLALTGGVHVVIDERLREINFGSWEGCTREEIRAQIGNAFDDEAWHFRSPGGETFEEISARITSFLHGLSEPAIVVTHGVASAVLRGHWLGLSQGELLKLPRKRGCVYLLSKRGETVMR